MTALSQIAAALAAIGADMKTALANSGGGTPVSLNITTEPDYIYDKIWAEENAAISSNQAEYSYGNGAAGPIGIPHNGQEGWEVVEMFFQADVHAASAVATVVCKQFETEATNNPSYDVCEITINGASDGGGQTNHSYKTITFDPPKPLPFPTSFAPLGFYTETVSGGTISDVRVGIKMRRKVGDKVIGVSLQ